MKASKECVNLIKQFEGCRLDAYKCPAGVWTIGYGHTANVKSGDKITAVQAEAYLLVDIERFEKNVEKFNGKYNWTQNEFDALVSFAYNIGSIDGLTSGGGRSKQEIADKMLLYNKGGGKVLPGLVRRRNAERELFMKSEKADSGISWFLLSQDSEKSISKNFKLKEFRCKDGSDRVLVDVDFVRNKLQAIRDYFNAPVTVNSAYRTEAYNSKIGGAKASYHCKGQAFDIVVKGKTPLEVAKCAQSLGIMGIIQYNTFVHVDSRATRYWARDDNGRVTVKASF